MGELNQSFRALGVELPTILLPGENVALDKWSTLACDQYTSQEDYWQEVACIVGDAPSALHLTLPEVYLHEGKERAKKIHETMQTYVNEGIFREAVTGFVYVQRQTEHAGLRHGLVASVDLEQYDFSVGSQSLIRPTEGTIEDRLPPRMLVREGAAVELPHVILLIDDAQKTVIEPLAQETQTMRKLYDFDLMMNGGHIAGWAVEGDSLLPVFNALTALHDPSAMHARYDLPKGKKPLLFAVGDGNHSLATARACWLKVRETLSPAMRDSHPARFALVEICNLHDDGLCFAPIHRVLFGTSSKSFLAAFELWLGIRGMRLVQEASPMTQEMVLVSADGDQDLHILGSKYTLSVGILQAFMDSYLQNHPSLELDYVHGDEAARTLGMQEGNCALLLPSMPKHLLFSTVLTEGVLPRKAFSLGEADEKRFYLEARRIQDD